MSKAALSFIIDADIARSSGTSEHPIASGSRKLLENLTSKGHKVAMCPSLMQEWKKHRSHFATKWLASMVAKKKIHFIVPAKKIQQFIENSIEDCKDKEIALKDCHLVDAALLADRIIASNDDTARKVFCTLSKSMGEIGTVSWFNAVTDGAFISGPLMDGEYIPEIYYLRAEGTV